MPDPVPHHYSASLSRTDASHAWIVAPSSSFVPNGRSPELDGNASAWSPEHVLLSSLGLCMLTTFEMFAARHEIELLTCDAKIGGTVEQTPEGLMFTSIVLELDLALAGNVELVEDTLEDAKQCCVVLNSLRVPVVVEAQLRTPNEVSNEVSNDLPPLAPRDALGPHHAS